MYEETELDTLITLCIDYKKEELADKFKMIKGHFYNNETGNIGKWWGGFRHYDPLLLKRTLRNALCHRKQQAKKLEIASRLDEVLGFLDKADHYKEIVNAYYYQGEKTREAERALQQKQLQDAQVQSIEEALLKFDSMDKIDTEWLAKRYAKLEEEAKCATSAN